MSEQHEHRLWAPFCERVSIVRNDAVDELTALDGGYFALPRLEAGDRYAFLCDDETEARPDPRSRLQPLGVDGPSEWWSGPRDAELLEFTPVPLSQAVLYELHVGTFTDEGTFEAALKRLPHLLDLGITHIQLMPVASFMGDFGWGYDGVALFAVHAPYGGPEGLLRFVRACHRAGLAVILDVVYNHLGPSGNHLARYGPYFTDRYQTSWGAALNFDGPQSDEVRRFFIDNAKYWLCQFGIDGLRLDAIQAIFDASARHFLEELALEVETLSEQLRRPITLIAETHNNDPRIVRSVYQGGRGMHCTWSDDFHHALHALLTSEQEGYYQDFGRAGQLAEVFERGFYFDGRYCKYYQRRHGASAEEMESDQFLVYMQNHDQVGNRAKGDRIGHALTWDEMKVGAAALLLGPFVPMLFQGEEWGATTPFPFFADPPDEGLARAIRRGRLNEYKHFRWKKAEVPDPVSRATFEGSRLIWDEAQLPEHAALLAFYRRLVQLRKKWGGCVPRATLDMRCDEKGPLLCFRRADALVVLHFGEQDFEWPLEAERSVILASREDWNVEGLLLRARGPIAIVLQV